MRGLAPLGALAVVLGAGAAGCVSLPWGGGGLAEELGPGDVDPHGLVIGLGPEEVAASASRLTNLLPAAWVDGVAVAGEVTLEAGLGVSWDALQVSPGPVALRLDGATLVGELGLAIPDGALALEGGWETACAPRVALESARLEVRLSFTSDKLGRLQLAIVGAPLLDPLAGAIDWSDCLALGVYLGAAWDAALWRGLAEAVADALAPELLAVLPRALGVDVAMGLATAVAVDELGAGFAWVSVRADGGDVGATRRTSAGLAAVFSVGVAVDGHPCMPEDAALTPIASAGGLLPEGVDAGALAISGAVVRRALEALWLGGAMCGDHATEAVSLPARALVGGWHGAEGLDGDTAIGMHLWPRELPRVALAADGPDRLTVATGPMDVALFAAIDGAQIRLATLTVDIEVVAGLEVAASGVVTLDAQAARVRGVGARAGLFAAPEQALAEVLLVPLVEAMVDGRALVRMPPRPGAGAGGRARIADDRVVIGK